MVTKMEYVRVLSCDLKMFFKINKCIFIGVRKKAFTIQSKKKIGAWAHMRPPLLIPKLEFLICINSMDMKRIKNDVNAKLQNQP